MPNHFRSSGASSVGDFRRTIFINFVICGVGSALGGILYAASLGSSSPALGWPDMHMLVIAACVLGGAKLSGGYGNLWFSMVGVMILGIVINIIYAALNSDGKLCNIQCTLPPFGAPTPLLISKRSFLLV